MDNNRVEISVHEGKLIGIVEKSVYDDYNYVTFRGIPYAKPPIGELRFKDPVPPEPWSGDRDASKFGNNAVQINFMTHEIEGDEDCLYLNVYTTKIESSKKRAVMVWIHGGSFNIGSGDTSFFGPDYIVRKDVILVTLNYRLGVLGFLNLNNKVVTGNQGLKDVIMALQWVKKNISNFGGDSENVTIFGESAGAVIVHCLTISPLAKGLFHKAISQSGVIRCPWAFTDREPYSMNKGFRLVEKFGKVTADPKVAYELLKTIDAKKLIETEQNHLFTEIERRQLMCVTFTPSLDRESPNPVFPDDSETFMSRGVKVPFLLGFNSCEASLFTSYINYFKYIYKENLKIINSDFKSKISPRCLTTLSKKSVTVEELRFLYFGDKAISEETLMNYIDFLSDEFFCHNIMEVVENQTKLNNNDNNTMYLYKFSYESEASPFRKLFDVHYPGAFHGEELPYLFYSNIMKHLDLRPPAADSEDYKMINCLTQMWTDFAKTGNPTPVTNLWLSVNSSQNGKFNYLDIDTKLQMKVFRKGEERWDWQEKIIKLRKEKKNNN